MNDVARAMRYASNTFQRFTLAVAATLYALTTAFGPNLEYSHSVQAYQALALSSGYKWAVAAIFGLDAFCIWWRLWDKVSRVYWALAVNIFTATLWVSIAGATIATYKAFLPDSVGEVMMALIALFSVVRTNKTVTDVETA